MKYDRTQIEKVLIAWDGLADTYGAVFIKNPDLEELETYLFLSSELSGAEVLDRINLFLRNLYLKENAMSTAESLIEMGQKKGFEQGSRQNALETARRMKLLGLSADIISASTGLELTEIQTL